MTLNKLVLSTITLAASAAAYAATSTGLAPFDIRADNAPGTWEFNLAGMYLKPTSSSLLDYADVTTTSGSNTATNVNTLKPSYGFGFELGFGYIFPDSAVDAQFNWTHYNHSTQTTNTAPVNSFLTTIDGRQYIPGSTTNITSYAGFGQNAADADVGYHLSIGTRLSTRLFAGLRYAKINSSLTDTYAGAELPFAGYPSGQFSQTDAYYSKFTGIGPRTGVDASYNWGNGLGLAAHAAAALLIGRSEASQFVALNRTSRSLMNQAQFNAADQTRIVPEVDAKLGVNYSFPIPKDRYQFTIEGGYQATQYIKALNNINVLYNFVTGAIPSSTETLSGLGFSGPYLSLNLNI